MRVGSDTVCVVTGASGGVGRATARMLGERGAKVVLLARGHEGLEGAKRDVESRGGRAIVVPTDVSNFDQVQAAADAAENEFGSIDLWINNAMVSMYSPFMKMSPEEFQHIVNVTFLGTVHGTRCALQRMLPRDRGKIIQVGSALAFQIDSIAERLLRQQACDSGLYRVASHRVASREKQCRPVIGEYACVEYDAIRVDEKQNAA